MVTSYSVVAILYASLVAVYVVYIFKHTLITTYPDIDVNVINC